MLTVKRLFVAVFVAAVAVLSLHVKGGNDMATPDVSLLPRGCLRTLRVRLSPNLPSEMLRISSAHFEDGGGDHPWASRINPQGYV